MARSLARNTELFVSTQDNTLTGSNPENLFSVKVLDGYSFSQDVVTSEVGVNEAGSTPVRGTLGFNTALNPVDVSFSTYVRVHTAQEDIQGNANAFADCVERVLWASALGSAASWTTVTTTGPAASQVITAQDAAKITFGLGSSNTNTLKSLTLYFKLENTTYVVEDFNVSTAEVDFSIDGIATINWSGFGSRVTESQADHATLGGFTGVLVGSGDYRSVPPTTTDTFLRNKLSTLQLVDNETGTPTYASGAATIDTVSGNTINFAVGDATTFTTDTNLVGGRIYNVTTAEFRTIISITDDDTLVVDNNIAGETAAAAGWATTQETIIYDSLTNAGVTYTVPITGATLTIENNFTYLTPEELAIVNLPLAGYSGNRVVSGSLTAYLNTGAEGTGGLLQDMLAKIEGSVTNSYSLIFSMGASSTGTPRVDFTLGTCQLAIPSTNVEDLISTEISFTSKPSIGGVGSFEATNELVIDYYDKAP